MLARISTHLLLRPEEITPSAAELEVVGVFNPGVVRCGDETVLLVRVAERPREQQDGWLSLPRIEDGRLVIEQVREHDYEWLDPRVVRRCADGVVRLTFVSHLLVARSRDGQTIDGIDDQRFMPHGAAESFGVEDARITAIGDEFYITYVAVSPHGAATALAKTRNFRSFERLGIIFPPENKDVVLFSEKINDRYAAIHRPNGATRFTRPEMWLGWSHDLKHWGDHRPLPLAATSWQSGRVGAGTPPIRVAGGWLEIYHGNERPARTQDVGRYTAGALLLHDDEPWRIVKRSPEPLLVPTEPFERRGFVPNVVFPTGIIDAGDRLLVYYGAADKYTAMVAFAKADVLAALETASAETVQPEEEATPSLSR